jgi:hypothetical protein
MMLMSRILGALLAAVFLLPALSFAVTLGQLDTFQDGTLQNWIIGAPTPITPLLVANGGPAGNGDAFMLLTAVGDGSPNVARRLAVINEEQWAGNYPASGVNAVSMSVKNLGATELVLRLMVAVAPPAAGFPPTDEAVSTAPVLLPAGSGWTKAVFPVTPADFTATRGSALTALTRAAEFRLIHNPNPTFPPPVVGAQLGVDNIHAERRGPLPYLPLLLLDD